ncbi:1-acyl-sn-glycerol-3-phosphate acyltransferase [Plastorhodobacter daqingensis]|uniref:Glycerol-3-phosphate acyltransferase n=1 Tax=Plastorhodobacter daqingensis TaxID=1387281 RepID=A0ABW2UI16_9RHOB
MTLPIWLVVLALLFAAVAVLDRMLVPSVRWFFRRRMERAVAELNKRLIRPIRPFKLMRRQDMIVRLSYDPQVMEAVVDYAREKGMPESVAFQQARRYAREIVPGFSAATYFGFAIRVARWLSRLLYRVRLGQYDEAAFRAIDPQATVIFVMNHRSNMDYVLVTYLVAERSTLSYAVGEWARVWPLQRLVRAMGAYFIRRRYMNPLYRRVLARYVQMATAEGVTQAIFPEGGLSRTGAVGEAKKGLLHYILTGFDPHDGKDVVFVPVALNYDRVIEDRALIEAATTGRSRFQVRPRLILGYALRLVVLRLRGQFHRFGYAAVSFGAPLSLGEFVATRPGLQTDALAHTLMKRIREVMPVLPVPLLAALILRHDGQASEARLQEDYLTCLGKLPGAGALAADPPTETFARALATLQKRGLVRAEAGLVTVVPSEESLLGYYAASVAHLLEDTPSSAAT